MRDGRRRTFYLGAYSSLTLHDAREAARTKATEVRPPRRGAPPASCVQRPLSDRPVVCVTFAAAAGCRVERGIARIVLRVRICPGLDQRVDGLHVVALGGGTQLRRQLRHDVLRAPGPCRGAWCGARTEGDCGGAACAARVSPAVGQCHFVQHAPFRSEAPLAASLRWRARSLDPVVPVVHEVPVQRPIVRAHHELRVDCSHRRWPVGDHDVDLTGVALHTPDLALARPHVRLDAPCRAVVYAIAEAVVTFAIEAPRPSSGESDEDCVVSCRRGVLGADSFLRLEPLRETLASIRRRSKDPASQPRRLVQRDCQSPVSGTPVDSFLCPFAQTEPADRPDRIPPPRYRAHCRNDSRCRV